MHTVLGHVSSLYLRRVRIGGDRVVADVVEVVVDVVVGEVVVVVVVGTRSSATVVKHGSDDVRGLSRTSANLSTTHGGGDGARGDGKRQNGQRRAEATATSGSN